MKRKAVSHDISEQEENQANAGNQADRPAETSTKPVRSAEKEKPNEHLSPPKQAGPEAKRQKAGNTSAVAKRGVQETEADDSKGSQLEQPPKGKAACLLHVLYLREQSSCPSTCYVVEVKMAGSRIGFALQKSSSRVGFGSCTVPGE